MRVTAQWLITGVSIAQFCCFATAQGITRPETMSLKSIVEALEKTQGGVRSQTPYQVIRRYRLFGANDSQADSDVVAEVEFRPPANKDYRIQKSSGSNRGQQVVRRVLDHEIEATSKGNQGRATINRDNYDFSYMGEVILDGQPCYRLGLKPKRKERELITGEAWVDKSSFLVRQVEGEVAKTPSWWLKKVRVKLVFGYIEGTWLQTDMEAVADVRIVGSHTLTSHILDYRSADEVASTKRRMHAPDRKD
jgi:hypothetical protein